MKEFCIMVTYDCNWDCKFCITDTHNKASVTFEDLKDKLSRIEPYSRVSISGGEPGLVPKDRMKYIFTTLTELGCEIEVNTNGLFFKNYEKYMRMVSSFFYHCTEDLDISKGIILYDNIDYSKTEFMMVLTDENQENLEWFLDKYPDISFVVTGADQVSVRGKMGPKLSRINGLKIYHKYKDRIHPNSLKYLVGSCQNVNTNLERIK